MTSRELCETTEYETISLVEQIDHRLARIERMLAECTVVANRHAARERITAERRQVVPAVPRDPAAVS